MAEPGRPKFSTSFGVFSPAGHVVMAFPNDDRATNARSSLIAGGFSENEVTRCNKDEIIRECQKSNEQTSNPVQIGQDVAKIVESLALAKEGCGFLLVHAPEDERSKRAIRIVQPYGLKFAEKYNRLTLEELT